MLKSFILIAWRNIIRNGLYTVINVLSLVIGCTACLVIYLIAHYEFSFDTFHPDKERIYRVIIETTQEDGHKGRGTTVLPAMVRAIHEEVSGIEKLVTLYYYRGQITIPQAGKDPKIFETENDGGYTTTVLTESSYLDVFKYEWLAGNSVTALSDPFKVVLTESRACQYFDSLELENILGKEVIYNDSLRVTVSGIIKDWQGNTDFPLTDFISLNTARSSFLKKAIQFDSWDCCNSLHPSVFLKLEKGTTTTKVNSLFDGFIARRKNLLIRPVIKISMDLQPLTSIHFTGDFNRDDGIWHLDGDSFRKAHRPTLYGLMAGALFILIIAIVNSINLSTALSLRRTKEIGVRKVLGSDRKGLVIQFLLETFIQTLFAAALTIILINPVISAFSSYIPEGVKFEMLNFSTWCVIILGTLITSLLSGYYPAKVLSSYRPVLSLKGISSYKTNNKEYLRKGLIVFQFAISMIFIIGAIVIGNQIRFMRRELNFTDGTVISIRFEENKQAKVLADKIKPLAGVRGVALQGFRPLGMARAIRIMKTKGKYENVIGVSIKTGDEGFIPLYNMKLLAGRNLQPSDSIIEFVINRTYTRIMGYSNPEQALGQIVVLGDKPIPVVGVIEDFHEGSFHESIGPMVIANDPRDETEIAIKLVGKDGGILNLHTILSNVEAQWKLVYPDQPFRFNFLDDDIAWLYDKEESAAKLINAVMMITIFVACVGVFGLSMFAARARTKEIGVRKVLGASVLDIFTLLSSEFLLLTFFAVLISSPIAWYFMNEWLKDFAYHIDISYWVFILSGLIAIIITMLTVGFNSVKTALVNPIDSLRSE